MTPTFEQVQALLKRLPGLGYRSAERIALYLLVEKPERLEPLIEALRNAATIIKRCSVCGNLCEGALCGICENPTRNGGQLCVVEQVPDLAAIERAAVYKGRYHVLHGKLSPINGVGPENLNMETLGARLEKEGIDEVILALSNDIEGEATCHFIQESYLRDKEGIEVSRIGFGLPSGGGLVFADASTLKSALEGRREY